MIRKRETAVANTAGTTAFGSGDGGHPVVLSSSSADPNAAASLGQPIVRDYWMCNTPNCGVIIFINEKHNNRGRF